MNNGVTVKRHTELQTATETDIRQKGAQFISDADRGIQTAVVGADGRVKAVVGLNGIRYLPDPDPDPLDEILRLALAAAKGSTK